MDEFIAHPGNILPGYPGIGLPKIFGDMSGRFANNLYLTDDAILNQLGGMEFSSIYPTQIVFDLS